MPPRLELDRQALLVDAFQEARAKGGVDREDSALDAEHLVRVEELFVSFVTFVVHQSGRPSLAVDENNT